MVKKAALPVLLPNGQGMVSEILVGESYQVLLTRQSIVTGKVNNLILNTTLDKMLRYSHCHHEVLIQDYFPELFSQEREFILTGMSQEEEMKIFGEWEE